METVREESFGIIPLKQVDGQWEVLIILHKQGNHWGFPKGRSEEGEDPQTSAFRELEEETGLKVKRPLFENPIIEEYSFIRKGIRVEKKVHYFPAIVSGALILQPEEIRDGKWLPFDQAIKMLTFEEGKRLCKSIQEMLLR